MIIDLRLDHIAEGVTELVAEMLQNAKDTRPTKNLKIENVIKPLEEVAQ